MPRITFLTLIGLICSSLLAADPAVEVVIGPAQPAKDAKGQVKPGPLEYPFGVDFDTAGNMIIVEYVPQGRVFKHTSTGELTVLSGGGKGYAGDGGPMADARYNGLHNLAITGDNTIYLSDTFNHSVRRIDTQGVVHAVAGNGKAGFAGESGPALQAQFNESYCVSLNAAKDTLYVTDLRNLRIRAIDLATQTIRTVAGNGEKGVPKDGAMATESPLAEPRAAALDGKGNLYIVSRGGNALRVVKPDGKIYTVAGDGKKGDEDGPGAKARLNGPKHLCCDDAGRVYIADDQNHKIRLYDPKTGRVSTLLGGGTFKLNRPHGVTFYKGSLYVADSWNHRILKVALPK